MAQWDDATAAMQEALDDEDVEAICTIAAVIVGICRVVGDTGRSGAVGAGAVAVDDPEGDALYDPDELGMEPEEFDVAFWRKQIS